MSWSPDGSHILFASGEMSATEIYIMKADGTELERITKKNSREKVLSWSPDGSAISFVSDRDGNYEIYSLKLERSY
jgi:TolB protein